MAVYYTAVLIRRILLVRPVRLTRKRVEKPQCNWCKRFSEQE